MIPKQSKLSAESLTVDYHKIASIPIGKRNRMASTGLASLLANSLTPGQRAALFPRYYQGQSATQIAALGPTSQFVSSPTGLGNNYAPVQKDLQELGVPSAPGNSVYTSENEKLKVIMNTLMKGDPAHGIQGLPYNKARMLAANFYSESSWNTGAVGDKELGLDSLGLGQWNRERKQGLFDFATKMNMDWSDPATQSLYALNEFQTTHKSAYKAFMEAQTFEDEYNVLRDKYEVGLNGGQNLEGFKTGLGLIDSQGTLEQLKTAQPIYDGQKGQEQTIASAIPVAASADDLNFVAPVNGTFAGTENSDYGDPRGSYSPGGTSQHGPKTRKHSGSDWQAPTGSDAVFPVSGTVIHSGKHSGYANMVDIKGDDGRIYRLAPHGDLAQDFQPGQRVKQGDLMGKIAEGHLHMEVIPKTIGGLENPVYDQFDQALASGKNQFVSTSNQKGTVDPSIELGIDKGQKLVAGQSWKAPETTTVAQGNTFTLNTEEAIKLIKNTEDYKNNPLAKFLPDQALLQQPEFTKALAERGIKYDPKTNQVSNVDVTSKEYKDLTSQYPKLLEPTSDTQTVDMQAQQLVPTPIAPADDYSAPISPAAEQEAQKDTQPPQSKVAAPQPTQSAPPMADTKKPTMPISKDSGGSLNLAPTIAGAATSQIAAMERAKGGWLRGYYDI